MKINAVSLAVALALAFTGTALSGCSQPESGSTAPGNGPMSASGDENSRPTEGKSLTEALVMADTEGKNVLVEYWDSGCPWCAKMDEQTLSDDAVQGALGKVVHVRLEKGGTGSSFVARWGELGTPSYVVVRPDGSVPGSVVTGVVAKPDFLKFLAWAEKAEGPEPALSKGGS